MKRLLAAVFAGCFLFSGLCFGALTSYLTLAGQTQGPIPGECTQRDREDTILVYEFSHVLASELSDTTGQPTGKRQHKPIVIVKRMNRATPMLMQAWATAETMDEFTLDFYKIDDSGKEVCYYRITLEDAQIVGIEQFKPMVFVDENKPYHDMERVRFVYSRIRSENLEYAIDAQADWEPIGQRLVSDLDGDGKVNLVDLAITGGEWMETQTPGGQ